jgi:chromosome segregation protein
MHLTRLEIKGFKSFREKTVLSFPDKFTGIVGPNGSGKSNITEAICFVLGKSRGLRAANLTELIFNGGIGAEPATKAVVSITLKEDNGIKHKITRIVESDGQSVYKLDDKRTTRQKIIELVGDNEYNIILQDDITRVVEMKPRERRTIIDDLCGIGLYDEKRDKAKKELDKVEDRIGQTHIILSEKQGYMRELSRERDEALKYTDLKGQLRSTRATLLEREIQSLERRDEKIGELSNQMLSQREEGKNQIEKLKVEIQENSQNIRRLNQEIRSLEEEKRGERIAHAQGEILRLQDREKTLAERIEALNLEESANKTAIEDYTVEDLRLREALNELESQHSKVSTQVENESGKSDNTIETELDEAKNSVYESRSKLKALDDEIQRRQSELQAAQRQAKELTENLRQALKKDAETEKEHNTAVFELEKAQIDRKKTGGGLENIVDQTERLKLEFETKKITLTRKESELETINKTTGGLQKALQAVLRLKKAIPGVQGPIFQLGQVSDVKYKLALQAAAGARLQHIVVEKVNDATKCIEYLREKKIGRCTFLPLEKINYHSERKAPAESLGFIRDYIKYNRKYEKAFKYVFGDTIMVADLKAAEKIGVGLWRMVTLDGDLLELSGAITGGHIQARAEISFNNVEELEAEIAALQEDLGQLQAKLEESTGKRRQSEQTCASLAERIRQLEKKTDEKTLEKNLARERRESLSQSASKTAEKIKALDDELSNARLERTKQEKTHSAAEKRLNELMEKRGGERQSLIETLKDTLRDLKVEQTRLTEKKAHIWEQTERLKARQKEISPLKKQLGEEASALRDGLSRLESDLLDLEASHQSAGGKIQELIDERARTENLMQEISSKIGQIEYSLEATAEKANEYSIEKAKIMTRLEDLRREYSKYEGVELSDKSVKDLTEDEQKLSERLEGFGSVNLRSIESYDVVKGEYDELSGKLETLKTERQSIFDFMEKIEAKKRETFMQAFEKVKANFERIYAQLAEGRGTLTLDDPMNVSEAGLMIKASPGGKKVMSLDAMSGGEKVVTSSAFLLGIQQYKPSHFYIVDELDAALDKRNSIRLAQMLAKSSSQFLMVTHNNNMLKYMDSAIGVSMIKGASHIVGVRFNEQTPDEPDIMQAPNNL